MKVTTVKEGITVIEEVTSIEIGEYKFDENGLTTKGDVFVGKLGAGAGIIINDGNFTGPDGARIQAALVTENTVFDLPAIKDQAVIMTNQIKQRENDPTTAEVRNGDWEISKNNTTGVVSIWANDGGILKSIPLA